MVAYDLEIKEFFADAGFVGTPCAGPVIPSMGYAIAGQAPTVPGPLIFSDMYAASPYPLVDDMRALCQGTLASKLPSPALLTVSHRRTCWQPTKPKCTAHPPPSLASVRTTKC